MVILVPVSTDAGTALVAFRLHHKAKAQEFSSILALPPPPPKPTFKKSTFKKREVKLLFTACL